MEIEKGVDAAEADKESDFMKRVKVLGFDRLRAIFNRLSITKESQQTAITNLQEQLQKASNESPQMLQYTLIKIGRHILKDCQEEFFCEMDEGHPLKLARVVTGLCMHIEEFREILRHQFFSACPPLAIYYKKNLKIEVS